MRRQLVAVVRIRRCKSVYRLARFPDSIEIIANRGKANLPAAHESVHIEHHGFDPIIGGRQFECADNIALPDFTNRRGTGC